MGADLRKPRVAELLRIEGSVGLADVLAGRVEFIDALQRWGKSELFALPAGSIPPNPSELLGSTRMAQLVKQVGKEFDFVLYDAPPLLPVTDAAVLSKLVGGAIMVVASGKTRSLHLEGAIDALDNVGAPVSGIVLTMLPTRGPDAYGYGRYGYTYGEQVSGHGPHAATHCARGRWPAQLVRELRSTQRTTKGPAESAGPFA